ncbi:hypothetical protein HYH02_010636 [Chlamydomonas schloesseri]|uniref:ATP-dependent DNA helicase n=1 Tax=Chlamydomonas schloesseri TaxID=2026947 RepID=A0A835TG86_9CHLO|nr:hypothetical protein HYH02_010636 [Chlamydomonas schloesseri]|eukprot:KAG2439759.1 hypothetical protein HYH02_010636 [Chlamydomonas schloesseri]
MSSGVDFVCSAPPSSRTRTVHQGTKLCACPVDVYSLRPSSLQDVTFTSYFRDYRLVSVKPPRSGKRRGGRPRPAAAMAAATTAAAAAAGAAAAVAAGGLGAAAVAGVTAAAAAVGAGVAQAAERAATAAAGHEPDGPVLRQAPAGAEDMGLTQDKQHRVYKLRVPRIVRFSDYNPASDPEGYFYNLLLCEQAFGKEADLISSENVSGTYFEECRLRQLVQNTSDLEVHLQSYANYHLYSNQRRQALLAALLGKYVPSEATDDGDELDPEAATFTVNYGGLRDPPHGGAGANGRPRAQARVDAAELKAALAAEFEELDAMPYTDAQAATVEAILSRHSSGVVVLTGGPGSGKTFTTKKLTRQLRQQGKSVMLTASTGAAAVRLSPFAATNHSAFDLPVGRGAMSSWVSATRDTHPKAEALREADVFIIDEFSMVTDVQLTLILMCIWHATSYTSLDDMLANKLIILVGDHAQLPPVCQCNSRDSHIAAMARTAAPVAMDLGGWDELPLCEQCHICANDFFSAAPKYRLPASVRHAKDPEFAAFLDIIRTRRPTQAEIDAVFGAWSPVAAGVLGNPAAAGPSTAPTPSMYITEDMVHLLADEHTTVLCTHLEDAKAYNHAILERLSSIGAVSGIHLCPLRHDVPPRSHAEASLEPWLRDPHFKTIEQVAEGARVVLVENCDLHRGAANGAAGVVEKLMFETREDGLRLVSGIKVRLADSGKCITIGARTSSYNWFGGVSYSKHTFPLALGWAITAHRSQGATLSGPTIIHARSVFTPGQLYVMLSRVTERRHLHLVGPLSPGLFSPVKLPGFVEIDALAEKQAQAVAFVAAATAVLTTV